MLLTDGGKPECYVDAMEDENKKEWVDAMQDEMKSLYENNTFELVKLSKEKRAMKNRWVYRVKQEEHTSQPRYKARLVIKGFSVIPEHEPKGKLVILCIYAKSQTFTCIFCKFRQIILLESIFIFA